MILVSIIVTIFVYQAQGIFMVRPKGCLSKTQVATLLGCIYRDGRVKSRELRRGFFTDEVLTEINISKEAYKKLRLFTYPQSLKIIEVFGFDKSDLTSIHLSN